MKIAVKSVSTFVIGERDDYFLLMSRYSKDNKYIDRLFRKYVRKADTIATKEALLALPDNQFVKKLIEAFDYISGVAEDVFEDYGEYVPIRIVLFDEPYSMLSRNIPLEDYDNNDGEPFWMRPEYIIEKYSKVKKI